MTCYGDCEVFEEVKRLQKQSDYYRDMWSAQLAENKLLKLDLEAAKIERDNALEYKFSYQGLDK